MLSIVRCAVGFDEVPPPHSILRMILLSAALLALAGCRHHDQTAALPAPPPIAPVEPAVSHPPPELLPESGGAADSPADAEFVREHTPIYSEDGLASWYGPPYDKRRGANGAIYDENALTAAHRTLPLNSLIRVTNIATGQSVIVRVTDRGPFVAGRILDLSLASAKAVGVWRPGVARVRIEVFAAPAPLDEGGRWCVQIGAFKKSSQAIELRDRLIRKYHSANVIEFAGPTGFWVRIRPSGEQRDSAAEIARSLNPDGSVPSGEEEAFLVRLD